MGRSQGGRRRQARLAAGRHVVCRPPTAGDGKGGAAGGVEPVADFGFCVVRKGVGAGVELEDAADDGGGGEEGVDVVGKGLDGEADVVPGGVDVEHEADVDVDCGGEAGLQVQCPSGRRLNTFHGRAVQLANWPLQLMMLNCLQTLHIYIAR